MSNDARDMIDQFEQSCEVINYTLENGPDISDIDDHMFTVEDLRRMMIANQALLEAVRCRHGLIESVADNIRIRRNRQ